MFRFLGFLAELAGWFSIMVSPLLIGLGMGAAVYFSNPGTLTFIIGIAISMAGLLIGVLWATNIWKKQGTVRFLSEIYSTPEPDNRENGSTVSDDGPDQINT